MQTDEKRAAFIACSKKLLDYFIPFRIRCSPFVYDKHRTKGKTGRFFVRAPVLLPLFTILLEKQTAA